MDSDGRFLLCDFAFRDKSFCVACLYAPNRNPARARFFLMKFALLLTPPSLLFCVVTLTLSLIVP